MGAIITTVRTCAPLTAAAPLCGTSSLTVVFLLSRHGDCTVRSAHTARQISKDIIKVLHSTRVIACILTMRPAACGRVQEDAIAKNSHRLQNVYIAVCKEGFDVAQVKLLYEINCATFVTI